MACWALGRYGSWAVECACDGAPDMLAGILEKVLARCVDGSKRVQEAAISALAGLLEEAGAEATAYLEPLVATLAACRTTPSRSYTNLSQVWNDLACL